VPSSKDWADIKRFGANVRRERLGRAITQEELAELADLHLRTIQKIESGKINLLLPTLFRLKRALKCPWVKLLGDWPLQRKSAVSPTVPSNYYCAVPSFGSFGGGWLGIREVSSQPSSLRICNCCRNFV